MSKPTICQCKVCGKLVPPCGYVTENKDGICNGCTKGLHGAPGYEPPKARKKRK